MEYPTLKATEAVSQPADNFPIILQKTLGYEGNDKLDPTGPSKYGILEKNYQAYLKSLGKQNAPIQRITLPEASEIYRKNYYQANSLDRLPLRLSAVIFDWTVHSGAGTPIKTVQKIVGATPDGKVGPKTLRAINSYVSQHGEDALIEGIINGRRNFIERFIAREKRKDADGLRNRVNKVETDWLRTNHGIRTLKVK